MNRTHKFQGLLLPPPPPPERERERKPARNKSSMTFHLIFRFLFLCIPILYARRLGIGEEHNRQLLNSACSANPSCAGLAGNCCPTSDNVYLDCCPKRTCSSYSACSGLSGNCCPTDSGVTLACCSQSAATTPRPSPPPTRPPVVARPRNCQKRGKPCSQKYNTCCPGFTCLGNIKGEKLMCKHCRQLLQSCQKNQDCCVGTKCAIEGVCVALPHTKQDLGNLTGN